MNNVEFSEQELQRRNSLQQIRALGIEPYPAPLYPVNATARQIADEYDPEQGNLQDLCIAGRIMSRRITGARRSRTPFYASVCRSMRATRR